MAFKKSVGGILVVLLCTTLLVGITIAPLTRQAEAADRVASQCGEFTALELLSSIGKSLGKAAGQKAAGWAFGSVMRALGLGKPTTQDIMDKLDAGMAEINEKLDAILTGIENLENELAKYYDKSKALANYKDFDTYCSTIETAYNNWMLEWIDPYIGTEEHQRIPPEEGTPEYDDMIANLTKWANFMAADTYRVSNAMGQIHEDLVNPVRSVLNGIVDVAIDEAAVEWGGQDFATTVRSTNGVPVVADRVMYTRGDLSGAFCGGGVEPGKTHHFAEGYVSQDGETTGDSFILVQNEDATRSANAMVTFYQ